MRLSTRHGWRRFLVALALVSCTTDAPTGPIFRVSTISITGGTPDNIIVRNTSVTLGTETRAVTGALLTGRPALWSVDDPNVARVSTTGVVTAKGVGTTTVRVQSETETATRLITVLEGFVPPGPGVGSVTASALNDSVRLVMPGGAVPDTLAALHVRSVTASPADARSVKSYEFGPSGSQFSAPLTLRIRYNPAVVTPSLERAQLRIFGLDAGVWTEVVGGTVDTVAHEVIAPVTHFSQYAVFRRATPTKVIADSWIAPSPLYSGVAIGGAKTVTVRDAQDRPVPRAVVRFAITAGGGTIEGPDTASTDAQGRATFSGTWRSGPTPAANVLAATVNNYPTATAALYAVNAVLRPPVIVVDADSILRTGTAASVTPDAWTVNISNGGEIALTGLSVGSVLYSVGATDWLTTSFGGGTTSAPTTLTLTPTIAGIKQGTYTARVPLLSAVPGVAPKTLTYVMVLGQAPPVAVSLQTSGVVATSGEPLDPQPVVHITDFFGDRVSNAAIQVRVRVTCSGLCSATLRGDTVVTSVDGAVSFASLRLDGYGPTALEFSAVNLTPAVISPLPIIQEARKILVVTQPNGAIEGAAFATQPLLHVLDSAGLRVRGSTDAVVASVESGTGSLNGTKTRSAVDGIVTFTDLSMSQSSVGARLRFTQPSNNAQDVSAAFNVLTPARVVLSADSLEMLGTAAGAAPVAVTLNVSNGGQQSLTGLSAGPTTYGPGATAWLTTTFSGGSAAPTSLVFTPATSGIKQGVYTARVPVKSSVPGSVADTVVVVLRLAQAPAVRVALVTPLAGAVSGVPVAQAPVVHVVDAFGDRVVGAAVPLTLRRVTATCTGPCASTLLGDTTITSVDGVATFSGLQLDGYGPIAFEVLASGLTTATLPAVTIVQQVTALGIVTQPSGAIAGAPLVTQPVIHILDAAGLRVRGSSATVTATLASGTGGLVGTTTVAATDGIVTYTGLGVSQSNAGATLRFTQASSGAQVVSSSFNVLSPAAIVLAADSVEMLAVAAGPSPASINLALTNGGQQALTGLALGTVIYGAGASEWLTVSLAGGVTTAPTTVLLTPNSAGIKQGTYTARVPVSAAVAGTSADTIVVVLRLSQAPAVRATLVTPIAGATSGSVVAQQPVVRIDDAFGDRVVGASVPVTLKRVAVSCPSACSSTISGDTVVTSVDGVATFTALRLDGYGPIAFEFSAPGLIAATQSAVTIVQVPTAVSLVASPSSAVENAVFLPQPLIHILDAAGLRVRGSTDSVTAALHVGAGALLGTTRRAAVDGAVAFTDLRISDWSASAALRFTQPSTGATVISAPFVVSSIVATLSVSPDTLRLSSIAAQQLVSVDARDAASAPVASPRIVWRTLNAAVASVNSDGRIRSVGVGTTKVIAEIASLADTVVVIVTQVPVAVTLTPDTLRFTSLTDTLRLSGTIRDAAGSTAPGSITYSSLDTLIATVNGGGLVTALGIGSARVVAAFGALADTTVIQVSQVPASVQLSSDSLRATSIGDTLSIVATVRDARGVLIPTPSIAWVSTFPAVAQVIGAGAVEAMSNGTTQLVATAGLVADTATMVVRQVAVNASISTDTVKFGAVGSRRPIGFIASDARGIPVARTPSYLFSVEGVATISADTVASVGNGTTNLTISEDTIARTVTIVVAQVPVAFTATPDTLRINSLGDTLLVNAAVRDSNSVAIASVITFASSDSAVAAVRTDGRVISRTNGTAVVLVTSGTFADSVVVLVQQLPASVTASADSLNFGTLGRADTLSAVASDARGALIDGATINWNSTAPAIVSVDADGIVTALGNGAATLTAAFGTALDSVVVRVAQFAKTIVLNSDTVRFATIGRTRAVLAVVTDSGGAPIVAAQIGWTSAAPGVVEVDTSGTLTSRANGTTRVVATIAVAKDTVVALVQQVPTSLIVAPSEAILPFVGARDTLAVTVVDSAAFPVAGSPTTWQTANAAVATVASSGEVTATGSGSTWIIASAGALRDSSRVTVSGQIVALWGLNGNALDATAFGNNGTILGGVTPTADRFGNAASALQFNGVNGAVRVPMSTSLAAPHAGPFTASLWFKPSSVSGSGGNAIIFAAGVNVVGWSFQILPDGRLFAGLCVPSPGCVSATSATPLTVGRWYHAAARVTGGAVVLFIDGVSVASAAYSAKGTAVDSVLTIGGIAYSALHHFNGSVDDARFYRAALGDAEIAALSADRPCGWCGDTLTFVGNAVPADWTVGTFGAGPGAIQNARMEAFATDRGIAVRAPGAPPAGTVAIEITSTGQLSDISSGMQRNAFVQTGNSAVESSILTFLSGGPPAGAPNQLVIGANQYTSYTFPSSGSVSAFTNATLSYTSGATLRITRVFKDDSLIVTVRRATDLAFVGRVRLGLPGFRVAAATGVVYYLKYSSGGAIPTVWADDIQFKALSVLPIEVPASASGNFLHVYATDADGDYEIVRRDNLSASLQVLTSNFVADADPSFSPDGTRIVFSSARDGNDEIYVMNADGSSPQRLTNYAGSDHSPTWSPDGRYTAFIRDNTLHVMNADGTNVRRLTTFAVDRPDWINDTTIVFGYRTRGLSRITVSAAENASTDIYVAGGGTYEPAVSHDRSRIAFRHGLGAVYTMAVGGPPLTPVLNANTDEQPVWLPGDSLIITRRLDSGVYRLFSINVATGAATAISDAGVNADSPGRLPSSTPPAAGEVGSVTLTLAGSVAVLLDSTRVLTAVLRDYGYRTVSGSVTWQTSNAAVATVTNGTLTGVGAGEGQVWAVAANGIESNRIAIVVSPPKVGTVVFQSDSTGTYQLYRVRVDGSQLVRLTNSGFQDNEPNVSPDGTQVLFRSNRDGNWDLYRMNIAGTGVVRLTNSPNQDTAPVWSRDGAHIAWIRDNQLWVMRADTTNKKALHTNATAEGHEFASDSVVVFATNTGLYRQAIGSAVNTNVVPIWTGGIAYRPAVSPDGNTISARLNGTDIYTMSLSGANITKVFTGLIERTTWTRDGQWIIYSSYRAPSGPFDLWIMRPNGDLPFRLTSGTGNKAAPNGAP